MLAAFHASPATTRSRSWNSKSPLPDLTMLARMRGAPRLTRGQDGRCCTIRERRAHQPRDGAGHRCRVQHLVRRHLGLELGERIEGPQPARLDCRLGDLSEGRPTFGQLVPSPDGIEPHEHASGGGLGELGAESGPLVARKPVFDAGQRRRAVTGPHLFDADHEYGRLPAQRSHGAHVERGGSACTGIVDVDDPRALQTEIPEPGLPTDGPLVREPAAERISHDDQTDLGGRDPRVAQSLRCRLYGESVWALVPTVQGRHGDPGDAYRFSHEDHLAFVSRGA